MKDIYLFLIFFFIFHFVSTNEISWKLIRGEKVFGYGFREEVHKKDIFSLSVSDHFIITCSEDQTVNFYYNLMYPNLYPHWTHIYYGKLFLNVTPVAFAVLKDQSNVLILSKENGKVYLHIKMFWQLKNVYNRGAYFGSSASLPSVNQLEDKISFHIVHPRDEYNFIWINETVAEKMRPYLDENYWYKEPHFRPMIFPDSESPFIITSSDNLFVAVITNANVTIIPDHRLNKRPQLVTSKYPIKSASFSPDSKLLFTVLNDNLNMWSLNPQGQWIPLDFEQKIGSNIKKIVVSNGISCKRTNWPSWYSIAIVGNGEVTFYWIKAFKDKIMLELGQHIYLEQDPIVSFSPDDEVLAVGSVSNHTIQIFIRCEEKKYCFHSLIESPLIPKDLVLFNLKYYYLIIPSGNKFLIFKSEDSPTVPECDPKLRSTALGLPLPPMFDSPEEQKQWITERDGIFHISTTYVLALIALLIFLFSNSVNSFEQSIIRRFAAYEDKYKIFEAVVFYIACFGIFVFSLYEIVNQRDFMNDWPAHIRHVEQYWLENTLDYSHYMHTHGPCTYPGGFLFLYTPLYILTGGSLQLFQLMWAILEVCMFLLLWKIIKLLKVPGFLVILSVLSNRLHLYNVRVVINDFPSVFLMYLAIYQILKKRYTLASIIYSFVLSTKLNFVFYGVSIAVIYLKSLGFIKTFYQGILIGLIQILMGLPFLLHNPMAYLTISYDLGRTLLWEKTRSFKFVGRVMYDSKEFHIILLAMISILLIVYLWKVFKAKGMFERIAAHALFFSNFLFVAFARGLYTPFMCWYFYTFPFLVYTAGFPFSYILGFWGLHEYLFRFFSEMEYEMFTTYVWFLVNMMVVGKTLIQYSSSSYFDIPEIRRKKE